MKNMIIFIVLICTSYSMAAEDLKHHISQLDRGGLEKVLKERYLRVLTTKNPYDYYIYQGKAKGIQYEMIKEFTKYLNKKYTKKGELRIVFEMIPVDFDQLIPMLEAGQGDIIAVGLTKTSKRELHVDFTTPYRKVDEVIVTRKEFKNKSLDGATFHIQKNSSYERSLLKYSKDLKIKTVDSNFHGERIMEFISLKKYDYTLINSFWAQTISKMFPNLIVLSDKRFRKNIDISWAVRKNNSELLKELNQFLPRIKKGTLLGNLFSYKYFYNIGRIENESFNLKNSKLSRYDQYIRKYAKKYNFDWRLVAALAFQESKFNQAIENEWGAIGLFQIKQMTANEPYISIKEISGEKNVDNNAHAGIKYLAWIKKRYFDPKKEMSEQARIRMMLAAYNAGPRRVLQAINKTKEMGLNPNKWFRNVELGMLKLGYSEPVIYVSEINKHYVSYNLLGISLNP